MKISASFLSSKEISKDLKKLNLTDVDYIHVDYMDGKFVPNKSLSFGSLKKIYKYTSKRLDVHLMMEKPEKVIRKFAKLNTEYITIHEEIEKDLKKILWMIHAYGIKAGIALNPTTEVEKIIPLLEDIDLILIMGVTPGYGGQSFIEETEKRVKEVRKILKKEKCENILISVDGGINQETKNKVSSADILVSGSYITKSNNFQERITELRNHKTSKKVS